MKKEKVICITDSFNSGGAQKQMVMLANGLLSKGYEVSTLQYYDLNFFSNLLNRNIVVLKTIHKNKIIRVFNIIKILYEERPNIIITYLHGPNLYASLYKFFFPWRKVRLITGERNFDINGLSIRGLLYRIPHLIANKIVCNSNKQRELLLPYFGDKLVFIANGTKSDKIFVKEYDDDTSSAKVNLILSGRLMEQKNPIGLFKAILEIKDKLDIIVHWYGEIYYNLPIYKKAMSFLNKNDLENNIIFHKQNDDIYTEIKKYDGLILPSFYEGCPNAIIDGMFCGVPILASDVSDNSIYLDHQKELLFDPLNPIDIASKILFFSKLKIKEKKTLGILNRNKAELFFDLDSMVDKYIEQI